VGSGEIMGSGVCGGDCGGGWSSFMGGGGWRGSQRIQEVLDNFG